MALSWSYATPDDDTDEYREFNCWDGDDHFPWVEEVENFIRHWVLRKTPHVLSFRAADGELAAVAAFERRNIYVPLVDPELHAGWHLQVVAVRLEDQSNGLSRDIFTGVFEAMRQHDDERILYTAHVHRENGASIAACAKVGLDLLHPKDDHYWVLLGEVPAADDEE